MKRKYEMHGYTTEEVKKVLFKEFLEFMRGQTYSIIEGEKVYNVIDVDHFLASRRLTNYAWD